MRRLPNSAPQRESQLVSSCRKAAEQMGAYLEVVCQRGGRGSGTTKGAPDAFLYASGRCLPVEFKTAEGRLRPEQQLCRLLRREQRVETRIVRSLDEFIALVNDVRRGQA